MTNVTCIGLTTLDLVLAVDALPQAGGKVQARRQTIDVGGPAANAARIAAALGSQVRLVTALGSGPLARVATDKLDGIEVVNIAPVGHELAVSAVMVTPGGDRTIVSRNTEAMGQTRPFPLPDDAVVVLHDGHLIPASQQACRVDAIHLLDAGSFKPGMADLIEHMTCVVASGDFAMPNSTPQRSLDDLRHVPMAARSAGAGPIQGREGSTEFTIPVPPVHAIDTTGAGDVLHGALAHHLASGLGFEDALRRASEQASQSVRHAGVMTWLTRPTPR